MPTQYSKNELKRRELLKVLETGTESEVMTAAYELTKIDRREGHLHQALATHLLASRFCGFYSPTAEGKHYNGLGLTYQSLWERTGERAYFDQSGRSYREAIQIFKRENELSHTAYSLNNLAALLITSGKTEQSEAHKLLDEAGRIFKELGERARMAEVDDTRARCYLREGKTNEALIFVNRSIIVLAELNELSALEVSRETHRQILEAVGRKGEK